MPLDYRGNGAFEREQNAQQRLAYVDFIDDENPDFTMKHQIFYDNIDSFKDSYLPYGERQWIKAVENKFTVTQADLGREAAGLGHGRTCSAR